MRALHSCCSGREINHLTTRFLVAGLRINGVRDDFSNDGKGATLCSTVALQGGSASCTTGSLAPGTYSLGAAYNGDATDAPSTAPALAVTVLSASDAIYRNGFDAVPNGCPAM